MPLGVEVGLGQGRIVLDGDPAPPMERGTVAPHFRNLQTQALPASVYIAAHVCCGQTAGWIKMPLGTEVGLGPGHIVFVGDPAPPHQKGDTAAPTFRPMSIVAKRSPISAIRLSCCC